MSLTTDQEAVVAEVKPEFKPHGAEDDCDLNPEFAVICSFIANFCDLLDVNLNIDQLKYSIEDQSYLDDDLIDLHVKLLKKVRRYFVRDQWEKALIRFTSEYSYEDAYELETLGYQKTRPSIKLTLLRRLLEAQFECDQKFKASVNLCEADKLRNLNLGRDIQGNSYWHSVDTQGNFKIYQEEPLNYKSWRTICSKPEELEKLINDLESKKEEKVKGEPILEPYNPLPEIFPDFFFKKEKLEELSERNDIILVEAKVKSRNNRNNNKKTNSLPAVKEVEEEDSNSLSSSNNTSHNCISHRSDVSNANQLNGIKKLPLIKPSSPTNDCSNDSTQVKSAVEHLLDKVVSSLDFIIRPLTKSPSPTVLANNKPQLDKSNDDEVKSQKKRKIKKEKIKEENLPRRSSSRIQQLQMKKIAEQEEEMKKKLELKSKIHLSDEDSRSQSSNARNSRKRSESPEDQSKSGKRKRRSGQTWRRGKGKKKLAWNEDDSDLSSTSTLTESNDELDDEEISFKFDTNYDDEFACEDEETNNNEPVIVKRARTARQSLGLDEKNDLNSSSILEEDKPCGRCDKSHDPEWILLCDMCDDGYHTSCCLPPLMIIPDGDWFCPSCEHKTLLSKLRELKTSIDQTLEAKERERKKNQRLRQTTIKKELIKTEIKEELPSRRQKDFLTELNDPIALQELEEIYESDDDADLDEYYRRQKNKQRKRANKTRKRRQSRHNNDHIDEDEPYRLQQKKSRKTYSRRQQESESEESFASSASTIEEEEVKPKTRRARASVSYRFQEYDDLIKSAIREDSYDEDNQSNDGASSPAKSNYGRGKDMATIEALAYQQENGITEPNLAQETTVNNELSHKPKGKKKARRLNDLDAASESENTTSDESFKATSATEVEDDDDELTEADISRESDSSIDELIDLKRFKAKKKAKRKSRSYDSDGSDFQPTQSRRAATKKVNYKESTDDDDTESFKVSSKGKKNILSSDSESEASWKSHDSTPVEDDKSTSCAETPELEIDDTTEQESQTDLKEPIDSGVSSARTEVAVTTAAKPEPTPFSPPASPVTYAELEVRPKSTVKDPKLTVNNTIEVGLEKVCDPIQELNQYCSESANSTTMFNSYIETLLSKNSPPHPTFYEEDEVKPP